MEFKTIHTIISLTVLVHLVISWRTQRLINSSWLTKAQKQVNSVLLWLLPFLWAFVVTKMIKPPKNPVTIKKDRKIEMGGNADGPISGAGGAALNS